MLRVIMSSTKLCVTLARISCRSMRCYGTDTAKQVTLPSRPTTYYNTFSTVHGIDMKCVESEKLSQKPNINIAQSAPVQSPSVLPFHHRSFSSFFNLYYKYCTFFQTCKRKRDLTSLRVRSGAIANKF